MRLDQFVPQLPSGVVDKNIVQRCVLYRERFHCHARLHRHLHKFGGGPRAVAGQHAVHLRAFVLNRGYIAEACSFASQSAGAFSNWASITFDPGTLALSAAGVSSATSFP